jgi:selenide,water dikinase
MVGQNDLSIEISYNEIPLMPGVKELVGKFIYPDITTRNFSAFSSRVNQLSAEQLFVLCDPQTSGGLLVAVDPASESDYLGLINQFAPGEMTHRCIGKVIPKAEKSIMVRS